MEFARFRLLLKVAQRAPFPADKGPMFRRGLLARLREASCGAAPGACPPRAPLPFVFTPPRDDREWYFAGETWKAELVLVGAAMAHAACYIEAFQRHCRAGMGPERTRVLLEQVDMLDPRDRKWTSFYFAKDREIRSRVVPFTDAMLQARADLLAGRERVTLRFLTPLRRARPVEPLMADALLRPLAERIARLGGPAAVPSGIEVAADALEWTERPRGLPEARGAVTLGGHLEDAFKLLVAGQHLHLGAGAAMGLGRYELQP